MEYLRRTGLKDYAATQGNRGVYVLRRLENDEAEFLLISLWESFDAIRRFSGPDLEKATYYPEDEEYLLDLEPCVTHYEIMQAPNGGS
jgi:heme-degrading monooxygenase HmoA